MSTDREVPPDRENADYLVPIPTALDQALRQAMSLMLPESTVLFCGWERVYPLCTYMLTVGVEIKERVLTYHRTITDFEIAQDKAWLGSLALEVASKLRDESRKPPPPEGAP